MTAQQPSIGRIVHYRLSEQDIRQVPNSVFARGNRPSTGDIYPAVIVRVNDTASQSVNLRVLLDGPDGLWLTSREAGPDGATGSLDGRWFWPPRVGA